MDLFAQRVPPERQHVIFRTLLEDQYGPERDELARWADGLVDRDGKFVDELQLTFESAFWELYTHAALGILEFTPDFTSASPDFILSGPQDILVEATIASPSQNGAPAFAYDVAKISSKFAEFNREAMLRICNSFVSKVKRYREYYSKLAHCADKPFVIAIGAYDRPGAHFAGTRAILAALYGTYADDDATIASGADEMIWRTLASVRKNESTTVPISLFSDDQYQDVSAVIYSALATWGKLRAMADSPNALSTYTTMHPSDSGLQPTVRVAQKRDYHEHLLDGLYVLHNPSAKRPIRSGVLSHARIGEFVHMGDGAMDLIAPDDLLLMRTVASVSVR